MQVTSSLECRRYQSTLCSPSGTVLPCRLSHVCPFTAERLRLPQTLNCKQDARVQQSATRHPIRSRAQHIPIRATAVETISYLSSQPNWDYLWAVVAAAGAFMWVKLFDALAGAGVLNQVCSTQTSKSCWAVTQSVRAYRPLHGDTCVCWRLQWFLWNQSIRLLVS